VIVTVLTPPPGYHELRRFQNQLAGLGYPNALALPPLLVLESDELPHHVPRAVSYTHLTLPTTERV